MIFRNLIRKCVSYYNKIYVKYNSKLKYYITIELKIISITIIIRDIHIFVDQKCNYIKMTFLT